MGALANAVVAVVTGGSSGNGRAIALKLAEEGAAAVVIADIQREPREGGTPTDELVAQLGVKTSFVRTDVSRAEDLAGAVAEADRFGGVTCMVNNAGVLHIEDFLEVSESDYDRLMAINVKGTFFGCQAAARSMIERKRSGTIINMSSVAGLCGSADLPSYATSKGAVRLLTYSLAASLGPRGIRVNVVHPGVIETAMTTADANIASEQSASRIPLRRNGVAGDVADAVLYLASDLSGYVNGASLVVDGGMFSTDAR